MKKPPFERQVQFRNEKASEVNRRNQNEEGIMRAPERKEFPMHSNI